MVELLIEKWCEPPAPQALHLSTLTHQILSVIAEHGGARAKQLFVTLCVRGTVQARRCGPFRASSSDALARRTWHWWKQAPDGVLLLGSQGERIVEHYSFYAVFQTPEEFRITNNGKTLGTLPVSMVLAPKMTIVFSGRRWRIKAIHDKEKEIAVVADQTGRPPRFGGSGGLIHDKVVEKMRAVLAGTHVPIYLDQNSVRLLKDARHQYGRLRLDARQVCEIGERSRLIATWAGTVKTSTLALALRKRGYRTTTYDGFIDVDYEDNVDPVETALRQIAGTTSVNAESVLSGGQNLIVEKYDRFLGEELLREENLQSRIDLDALPALAKQIVGRERHRPRANEKALPYR